MKKALWLIIAFFGWWHSTRAQSQGGEDEYYYFTPEKTFTLVPVAYYQTSNNWYMEGRYNYEALKTFSFYMGKTFKKESTVSYSFSPVAGLVTGSYNGCSLGANLEAEYKKFLFSSQFQYTFSWQSRNENFMYSWTDIEYSIWDKVHAGLSLQQTSMFGQKGMLEYGLLTKAIFKKWSVPLYVFNAAQNNRYYVIGLSREW